MRRGIPGGLTISIIHTEVALCSRRALIAALHLKQETCDAAIWKLFRENGGKFMNLLLGSPDINNDKQRDR